MIELEKFWDAIKQEAIDRSILFSNNLEEEMNIEKIENNQIYINVTTAESFYEIDNVKTEIEKIIKERFPFFGDLTLLINKKFEEYIPRGIKKESFKTNLNENYTLENYIVGDNNNMAYRLALALIEGETKYSPLLIYGVSGLGKTHLAHAIGNSYLKKKKDKKILYIPSTEFTNELVKSFSDKTTIEFKDKFRDLDMLIIDDIQFFEKVFGRGDDMIQKEFFDAFNALHLENKPIILIADKFPDQLKNFEERLISRMISGSSVELKMPDKSIRISLIKNYVTKEKLKMDEELIIYLADELETNIREIEGFMKTILSYVNLLNLDKITKELIDQELDKRTKRKKNNITYEKVLDVVSAYYEVPKEKIKGKERKPNFVVPRDVVRYILVKNLKMNLGEVGKIFGTDHSAVLKANRKIEEREEIDPNDQIFKDIKIILQKLGS